MATGSRENFNPAYEAFRKHSADLLTAIQDPEVLAWELFSESIITSAVLEFANNMMHERGERTSKLLLAMGSQIAVDPGAFDVFLSMFAKRPSMSDLCGRMRNTYGKSPRKICRRKGDAVVRCMVVHSYTHLSFIRRHSLYAVLLSVGFPFIFTYSLEHQSASPHRHMQMLHFVSLVPRPSPSFPLLAVE